MAESKDTRPCPLCGAPNSVSATGTHCQSCGGRMLESRRPRQEELAATERGYQQEGFSATWCGMSIGVVGILTAAIVVGLPMVVSAFDFEGSAGMMLAIPIWFGSGMLVGLISPGRTVLEPVLATFLVAMPTAFLLFTGQTVKTMPAFMYVLMSALGVLFAMIGSYAGERIQMGPTPSSSE